MALSPRIAAVALLLLLVGALAPARAQTPGSCTEGDAQNDLDINNVFARVFNTGSLFYGNTTTTGNGYYVPKASSRSPIFASGIWIGGQVGGQLRVAGSRYEDFNFWPGPLDASTSRPVNPANCTPFDRIYRVSAGDIADFEGGNGASADLADWPVELGAPVIDGDGDSTNYNLDGGDRPDIVGDQALFWVMNDVGNEHGPTNTPPLGVEVQVLAFAFSRSDAIGNTTFYRYRVINKSGAAINQTYLSVFSDVDLGNATDDFVGYDTELSMGFAYNADDDDDGATGYGVPPAVGYDFFQGPIVPDGDDEGTDPDTLGATAFSYFENALSGPTIDPDNGEEIYFYQQGLWADGTPMRVGGNGYGPQAGPITTFAFPGDPVTGEYWSEVNNNGSGAANNPGDRRFAITTGPFDLNNGDAQDIVFGVVFAQGSDRFSSITALRGADQLAQNAYDADFNLPPPPPSPPLCSETTSGSGQCLEAVALDQSVTLVWGYPSTSTNYLLSYDVADPFLAGQGAADETYSFEGFNIYRYPTSGFQNDQRELVATFDIDNGVTTVIDQVFNAEVGTVVPVVSARGTDSGIQYSITFEGLDNFTDYYYGVSAYAFNEESDPKVLESSPTLITARPSGLSQGIETQSASGDSLTVETTTLVGGGQVQAVVVDPTQITGDTYRIEFVRANDETGAVTQTTVYNIINATTGEVVFDGQAFFLANGQAPPLGQNVQVIDGFSYTINQPNPAFTAFKVVQNAGGPVNVGAGVVPPYNADPAFVFPIGDAAIPGPDAASGQIPQQTTLPPNRPWFINTGTSFAPFGTPRSGTYADFVARTTRDGANFPNVGFFDYEMRFTGSSVAIKAFQDGSAVTVPFELWNIGEGTPDDPSDDYRMVPFINDNPQIVAGDTLDAGDGTFNITGDHPALSGAAGFLADPFTDWVYWYNPVDVSPGEAGYNAYLNGGTPDPDLTGDEVFARMVLIYTNGGTNSGTVLPEPGTIFRVETQKGIGPGSVFTFNTDTFQNTAPTAESQELALDRIQVVPNPYMGTSTYETGNLSRTVRFTNLPPQAATIQIYTVAGTLVKTLRKEGDTRSLDWNLETEGNLPVASGMYLIHVDIEGVGERILKFGVVQRRTQITVF